VTLEQKAVFDLLSTLRLLQHQFHLAILLGVVAWKRFASKHCAAKAQVLPYSLLNIDCYA
jgi:hypothetical protein